VDSQRQFLEALDLDRSVLWEIDANDLIRTGYSWTREGFVTPARGVSATKLLPWMLVQLRAGRTIVVSTVEDVPSRVDRETLIAVQTKSTVVVPLAVGEMQLGALSSRRSGGSVSGPSPRSIVSG
jgi:hypothetical protein